MRRIRTALLVGVADLALLLPLAAPASASNAGGFVFLGTATTPPLGYPTSNGNSGTITLSSSLCTDLVLNLTKPGEPPAGAGLCSFSGSGSIGTSTPGSVITAAKSLVLTPPDPGGAYCGTSAGTIGGTFVDSIGRTYSYTVSFTTAGGVVVFNGTVSKAIGKTGAIAGVAVASPVPSVAVPPGNSCSARTATTFTIAGVAAFVMTV